MVCDYRHMAVVDVRRGSVRLGAKNGERDRGASRSRVPAIPSTL